ncbi:MAG: hypothetical protein ABF651_10050 [Sporolactobacillus sp.]
MVKRLYRQPLFMIGFLFLFSLVIGSVLYRLIAHNYLPTKLFLYKGGHVIAHSPLSPLQAPPLGTENRGYSLGIMMLIGAKYTLGLTLLITFIRMGLSSLFGTLYGLYFYRYRRSVNGLSEGFHYAPFTLLAVVILTPVLSSDKFTEVFRYTSSEREIAEILVLALLAVPVVSAQVGNIIGEISRRAANPIHSPMSGRDLSVIIGKPI